MECQVLFVGKSGCEKKKMIDSRFLKKKRSKIDIREWMRERKKVTRNDWLRVI